MDIETIEDSYHEQAYGEVTEHRVLKGMEVTSGGVTKIIDARSEGAFRHIVDGCLLTVDADILWNEADITVETARSELTENDYEYTHYGQFESFTTLESWLAQNATLVR